MHTHTHMFTHTNTMKAVTAKLTLKESRGHLTFGTASSLRLTQWGTATHRGRGQRCCWESGSYVPAVGSAAHQMYASKGGPQTDDRRCGFRFHSFPLSLFIYNVTKYLFILCLILVLCTSHSAPSSGLKQWCRRSAPEEWTCLKSKSNALQGVSIETGCAVKLRGTLGKESESPDCRSGSFSNSITRLLCHRHGKKKKRDFREGEK